MKLKHLKSLLKEKNGYGNNYENYSTKKQEEAH